MSLPVFEIENKFVSALRDTAKNCRIVIEAPTGSGKSTQVPQMMVDSGLTDGGQIYVLQPRRLAARMLARRVASERNQRVGGEVGYQVRFENVVSADTKIRYVTEGILIRRLLEDPELRGVSAVIFDEFHERHFFGDVSLARCLDVQESKRPDLKIIVMSATLEIDTLKEYLGDQSHHLLSEGRTFPVELDYCPPKERHKDQVWDLAVRAMRDHYRTNPPLGHALVFMPGRHEIRKTVEALKRAAWAKEFELCELYGDLAPEKQDAATAKSARPKIVVATNVAETSITIDDVRLVIDSGLERRSAFDSRRGITTLHIEKISRASSDQRAGRAGRTAPGKAIRLWSERDHGHRSEATPPEIFRMDLSEAVLLLKASGVDDVRDFRWFESPDLASLERAVNRLQPLGALDGEERLTRLGLEISRLPLAPRYGRILIEAASAGCLDYFSIIAAAVQSRPFFLNQKAGKAQVDRRDYQEPGDESDFQALVRAWQLAQRARFDRHACDRLGVHGGAGRDIGRIAKQLSDTAKRMFPNKNQSREPDSDEISRILLTGFSDRVAVRNNLSTLACQLVGNRRGMLEKSSIVAKSSDPFVAAEIIEVEGKDIQVKLDLCTGVSESLLRELFPEDFSEHSGGVFNTANRRVEAKLETRFRDLVLTSKAGGELPDGEAAAILAAQVVEGNLNLKKWDRKVEEYIARINLVSTAFPEYEIPAIDEEAKLLLIEQICEGATGYKDIKDRPVMAVLNDWIPAQYYGLLDRLAPERVELKKDKFARVFYTEGEKPKISVMIQYLFGIENTPTIGEGRIPLVVEILAPNQRPVQVTEDLAGFWKGSYAGVRAQLRGRYPKHDWPEPKS
ncbi:MAG: ATP-dependent helicase HrpB [Verrucomicrobiales bacterium]|nr:ATP-dependent helicase HrpB [Verrucomicrobiales bacterium]